MYIPAHFAEADAAELRRIIDAHPLGMLVTHDQATGLDAQHIPFLYDAEPGPHGTLVAHVARANPVWQQAPSGSRVLVVFRGAEAYVSPSWYPSKHEAHRQVPTWNYEVVHAHGELTVRDDARFVRAVVGRLTKLHEASQAQPWRMADAEPGYLDQMLAQIVGIEIRITELVGKRKLGQNREPRDRLGAADALQAQGQSELAALMRDVGQGEKP